MVMKKAKKLIVALLVVSIVASMFPVIASASSLAYGAATVGTSSLRLRSGPGTSHSVITHLNEGDIVVILERTTSEWYFVNFHGQLGYVNTGFLRDVLTAENFNAQGSVTGDMVNIRLKPNTSSDVLSTLKQGTVVTVIGINSGWYKVKHNGDTGYVRSDLMNIISGQRAAVASAAAPAKARAVSPAPPANLTLGQQIVEYALDYVGYKYVYGGASPSTGFDCSGFVTYVLGSFGVSVTRNASGQYRDNGVHISKSDLAPGDLVFFSSNGGGSVTHVGIYIGENEFVHASRGGVGVVISNIDSAYYDGVWYGAKRVL